MEIYAIALPGAPFADLFPDGKVPIVSPLALCKSPDSPPCYMVPLAMLSDAQIEGICKLAADKFGVDVNAVYQEMVRDNWLLLAHYHFSGFVTEDPAAIAQILSPEDLQLLSPEFEQPSFEEEDWSIDCDDGAEEWPDVYCEMG